MKDPFTSKIHPATLLPTILPRTPRGIRNERWSFILISIKCKYRRHKRLLLFRIISLIRRN